MTTELRSDAVSELLWTFCWKMSSMDAVVTGARTKTSKHHVKESHVCSCPAADPRSAAPTTRDQTVTDSHQKTASRARSGRDGHVSPASQPRVAAAERKHGHRSQSSDQHRPNSQVNTKLTAPPSIVYTCRQQVRPTIVGFQ